MGSVPTYDKDLGFKKEINCVDLTNPVMVKRWVVVKRNKRFRVLVADCLERGEFAFEGRFIPDGKSNLKVSRRGIFKSDKVDFFPVNRADIDIAVSSLKLKEYYVLENVSHIAASLPSYNGAKSLIGDVVFTESFKIIASFDVVSCCVIYEKGFAKRVDVRVYRFSSNGDSFSLERASDAVYGKRVANVVKDESDNAFKKCAIPEAKSGKRVFIDNRIKYRGKIIHTDSLVRAKRRNEWKSTKSHILGECFGFRQFWKCGLILGERQGLHRDFYITSSQKCRKFTRKKFGVGPRYIDICVVFDKKTVYKPFKFRNLLDLIKKNIDFVERIVHFRSDEFPRSVKCFENAYIGIFKIDGDDLIFIYTLREQFFAKQFQKGGFTAPAYSSNDFDDIFVLPIGEPVCEKWSFYYTCHTKTPNCLELFVCIVPKVGRTVNAAA